MLFKYQFLLLIFLSSISCDLDEIVEIAPYINGTDQNSLKSIKEYSNSQINTEIEEKKYISQQKSDSKNTEFNQFENEYQEEKFENQDDLLKESIVQNENQLAEELKELLSEDLFAQVDEEDEEEQGVEEEIIQIEQSRSEQEEINQLGQKKNEKKQNQLLKKHKQTLKEQREGIIQQLQSQENLKGELQGDQKDIIQQILDLVPDFDTFLGNDTNKIINDKPDNFNDFLDQLEYEEQEVSVKQPLPQEIGIEFNNFFQEYETHLKDFEPEVIMTFELEVGQSEILYENIHENTRMKGIFFIPMFIRKQSIDVTIKTEKEMVIYKKKGIQEGLFIFDIKDAGEYKFIFTNNKASQNTIVTFALDVHNATTEHMQHHDLNPFEARIDKSIILLRVTLPYKILNKDNYLETKLSQIRQEEMFQELETTQTKMLIFSFVETFGLIIVNIWQVFYIKSILENRRLI